LGDFFQWEYGNNEYLEKHHNPSLKLITNAKACKEKWIGKCFRSQTHSPKMMKNAWE
jgi:hypothetical protein